LTLPNLNFKNAKVACTANEISVTAACSYCSNFVPQKAPDSISEHAFFENFLGACPQTPLESSCFAFQSVLRTLQVNLPTHRNLNFILSPFTKCQFTIGLTTEKLLPMALHDMKFLYVIV